MGSVMGCGLPGDLITIEYKVAAFCIRGRWFMLGCGGPFRRAVNGEACWLCPKSSAPRHPRFILLESFSDTLLVVFICDMIVIWGRFCSPEWVKWQKVTYNVVKT